MAFESPGFANSGGSGITYSAEQTRRAVFAAYARTAANTPGIISGGLLSTADLQLTAPGSGMSVNVGVGECIVGGSEGGGQGGYYAKNSATVNLSIAAANATNPRIDTVCVTISDSGYTEPTGGSGNQVAAQIVTGTPTSGATLVNLSGAAALPLSSLLLGYVLVPATATNIITADIANKATVWTPGFFGTAGLGDGQPMVYNGSTGQWRSLASGAGNATFMQLPSAQIRRLSVGIFNGSGTILGGTADFSVSRASAGTYTVSNAAWPSTAVVVATPTNTGGGAMVANVNGISSGSFGVVSFASTTGTATDTTVSFIVSY